MELSDCPVKKALPTSNFSRPDDQTTQPYLAPSLNYIVLSFFVSLIDTFLHKYDI